MGPRANTATQLSSSNHTVMCISCAFLSANALGAPHRRQCLRMLFLCWECNAGGTIDQVLADIIKRGGSQEMIRVVR